MVEVIVAVALLAIVLTVLLRMELNSVSLTAKNHLGLKALAIATSEMDGLAGSQIQGEYTNSVEDFDIKAKSEQSTDTLVPMDILTLQVNYGNIEYAEIKTFKVRFF